MKKEKKYYFTKEHENAIVEYCSTADFAKRSELYEVILEPVLTELIEKIVFTYKFNLLPNIEDLKKDCKIYLTTKLSCYDPNRNTKAFAYFTVCTRNWFFGEIKKRKKTLQRDSCLEDINLETEQEYLSVEHSYIENREKQEFINSVSTEIESWLNEDTNYILGKNDIKVLKACQILFDHVDEIEIFNKKGIYLNLREITGLNTKQITRSLKKLKFKYNSFKKKWNAGDI